MDFQSLAKPVGALVLVAFASLFALPPTGAVASSSVEIEVLSSQPDRISGGDALVSVTAPNRKLLNRLELRLNGKPVTFTFSPDPSDPLGRTGLLSGLTEGRNLVAAWAPGMKYAARRALFNSPLQGPIFSGPHQEPYYCTTTQLGLGPALDSNCLAPTKISWLYRSTDNSFKPLTNPTDRPADMVQTTTRAGETVDYVVRREQGVINRAVYNFAILAAGGQIGDGWNGRFYYQYGGGCSTGHQQGISASGGLDHELLQRGFAVLGSSLNVFNTSCNDVLSAETTSMVKEHAIETLGRPDVWTAGEGGSGGSVQIQMIAQNYPGLLDGLSPSASFPDNSSPDYADCRLLQNYFSNSTTGQTLSNAQRRSITGMAGTDGGCGPLSSGADVLNATEGCIESVVPVSAIFDPLTNPGGVRCTLWDNMINVYGEDPTTGFARRSYDNTGVQYGLQAYLDGNINMKRFLDLNEFVGGFDDNGFIQSSRSIADQTALDITYNTGRLNSGAGNWTNVPVVDRRNYQDDDASGNVHQFSNTYRLRARLDKYNGSHGNHVMFRAQGNSSVSAMGSAGTDILSDWMDAIAADDSSKTQAQKVIDNRPAEAVDACWINGNRSNGEASIGASNLCETTYPPYSLPVNRAGKPIDSITAKCTLKPVNPADYGAPTPDQIARLNAIFPTGVCDWTMPGPGEQRLDPRNLDRSYGPDQSSAPRLKRKLRLKLNRYRAPRTRRGATVVATFTLLPCPRTTWNPVAPSFRVGKGRWKQLSNKSGSRVIRGRKCQTSFKLKGIRRTTSIKGYASSFAAGFAEAKSPVRTLKVKPKKRRTR